MPWLGSFAGSRAIACLKRSTKVVTLAKGGSSCSYMRTLHVLFTYQVALPVAIIHQIASVRPTAVPEGVSGPLRFQGLIARHKTFEFFDVDIRAIDTVTWPQDCVDVFYEAMEAIKSRRMGLCDAGASDPASLQDGCVFAAMVSDE
ncbi:hypothetical protein AC578_1221 [Pseudocercospora eumusae]|uniref:Uncharacterized protein n=1 Tax=Pseudocercospora eumusae TaxID=321146 RepID=A0A139HD08_9PEZI|nr:hypothetical protein AC578_1221 [Pseudocercospora eumusae]